MKLLILTQGYPSEATPFVMMFVHTRSLYYKKYGVTVDIISFNCKREYIFEGIHVYPPGKLSALLDHKYDAVMCHAPNLRSLLKTIFLNFSKLPKIFFVYHGHEILMKSNYYPPSYKPTLDEYVKRRMVDIYDFIKCKLWHVIIKKYGRKKFNLIFVSEYLRDLFLENIRLRKSDIDGFSKVIHNPLSPEILKSKYHPKIVKNHDFITIRPLNNSVYALDILVKLAISNPEYNFHIYGKGKLILNSYIPKNVKVINKSFTHKQLPTLFNKYRAGIMLSRHDSQGVMACDMAAYGLPLVVSDTPAANEMLANSPKVAFIKNDHPKINLKKILDKICGAKQSPSLLKRLHPGNTALKELEFVMDRHLLP